MSSNQVTLKRIAWIDNVKAFAILCVVISHCFHFFSSAPYEAFAIRPFVNAFNMHLFFFIAGVTSINGLRKIINFNLLLGYLHKIIWRISVPCFVYFFISHIVGGGINVKSIFYVLVLIVFSIYSYFVVIREIKFKYISIVVELLLATFTLSPYAGWFFQSFFITMIVMACSIYFCSIVLPEEHRLTRILPYLMFLILMYVVPIKATSEMATIYLIGALMKNKINDIKLNRCRQTLISVLFLILGLLFFKFAYYNGMHANEVTFYETSFFDFVFSGEWWRFLFRQLCAISLVSFFVLLIKSISKQYNIISWLGSKTLALYCIHCIILIVVNKYWPIIDITNQVVFCFFSACLGMIIFLVSCVFIQLFNKTRLTRILFLGEK